MAVGLKLVGSRDRPKGRGNTTSPLSPASRSAPGSESTDSSPTLASVAGDDPPSTLAFTPVPESVSAAASTTLIPEPEGKGRPAGTERAIAFVFTT
jgi:hypothetical protein